MFKDEVEIIVTAGKGGDGCVSFHRAYRVPKGGPDGGNGGRGGEVVMVADNSTYSLNEFAHKPHIRAGAGEPGRGANCSGHCGRTVTLEVPVGTMAFDLANNGLIGDLMDHGQQLVLARGGRGGYGNKHYATSINQAPRDFQFGTEGETRKIRLELKLIADVGLVGLPNAGKSTLLSRCSQARPKIAAYPFTTLEPQLGIVELGFDRLVMADIPGLIEGASAGKGLGHQFLRHIERTRVILHLVDLSAGEPEFLADHYRAIRKELGEASRVLGEKRELVVGNKTDIPEARARAEEFARLIGTEIALISGATGEGVKELLNRTHQLARNEP